jgi:hypothetical protein
MTTVNKETFLNAVLCPTLGWLTNSGEYTKPVSMIDKFNMEQGLEVHKRAKSIFPEACSITDVDIQTAANKTRKLLAGNEISVIYEAAFLAENCAARADILERQEAGWKLFEVKSKTNDEKELIDDMAYTVMVAQKAGLNITACSLLLISKEFRLGMSDEKLFREIVHTKEVLAKAKEFKALCDDIYKSVSQDTKPKPVLKWDCRNCPIFRECCGKGIDHHIFELPRISQKKFAGLVTLEVYKVAEIPDDFELTENQQPVKAAVKSRKPVIKLDLKTALEKLKFPAYYLDFETVNTAIPLYPATAPYTQIPVEYSLHKCSELGKVAEHFEYLSDPERDCRRELAERLINDCGSEGIIFQYTNFEEQRIKGLISLLPDLADSLQALSSRLVDLCALISKHFYHPDFHGSYSIKGVLPVLVPEMSYDGMNIADGGDAMAVFAWLVNGRYNGGEAEQVKKDLLEYCKLDTLAMVRLHESLIKFV